MRPARFKDAFRAFLVVCALGGCLVLALDRQSATVQTATAQAAGPPGTGNGPCGLIQAAFCDTFAAPEPNGSRAGDMNGVVWGASRFGGARIEQGVMNQWTGTQLNL